MSTLVSLFAAIAFFAAVWWFVERIQRLRAERRKLGPDTSGPYLNTPATLTVSPTELTVTYEGYPTETIAWADVPSVSAFQIEFDRADLLCLEFRRGDASRPLTIHEDMKGYTELTAALPNHLPGFTDGWMKEVGTPAFAAAEQVIWQRAKTTPS